MLLLGHLAIGFKLVDLFRVELPKRWILLGTVLPDLIDKSLYYSLCYATGQSGRALGLFSGTRTIGHTGLLLLLTLGLSIARGSHRGLALTAGLFTHLVLDLAGDSLELFDRSATAQAILFPLLGFAFRAAPPKTGAEHLASRLRDSYVIGAEVLGVALIAWEAWRYYKSRGKPTGAALRKSEP